MAPDGRWCGEETRSAIRVTTRSPRTGVGGKDGCRAHRYLLYSGAVVNRLAMLRMKQKLFLCVEWIVHVRQPNGCRSTVLKESWRGAMGECGVLEL